MTLTSNAQIQRKSYARIPNVLPLPRLTEIQLNSFEWFKVEGLRELFDEISPIVSFNHNLELHFGNFWFGESKYSEQECRERDMTFAAPLWVRVQLRNRDTGEISESDVFTGDFPLMTEAAPSLSTAPSVWWSASSFARRAFISPSTRIAPPAASCAWPS